MPNGRTSRLISLQRIVGTVARGEKINGLVPGVFRPHLCQYLHGIALFLRHIIDMGEIGVKPALRTQPCQGYREHSHNGDEPAHAVEPQIAYPAEEGIVRTAALRRTDKMGKKHYDKENGTQEQKSRKEAEIAQGDRLQWNQCQKGSNGRDVAYEQGHENFTHRVTAVRRVTEMCNEMKRIVDGYTYDDRRYTDNNDGKMAVNK